MTSAALLAATLTQAGSLQFEANAPGEYEYAVQTTLPRDFGAGEFTLTFDVRLANEFGVGSTNDGEGQRTNWSDADPAPYRSDDWWFAGNFLLDGHNNSDFAAGTFSVQIYGGGRIRWLFGDGDSANQPGRLAAVQAYPASSASSLLDGKWHRVALVRRALRSGAMLELWIDGTLVAHSRRERMVDMRRWWRDWSSFKTRQHGWFWGTEKQAAVGELRQWEDYKGLLDNVGFWTRALTADALATDVLSRSTGFAAMWKFDARASDTTCDALAPQSCWMLVDPRGNLLSGPNASR